MKKTIKIILLATLAITALSGFNAAHADTHTWNGAAITPNWSTPANWVGNNPPYSGEPAPVYIIFPAGAAQPANYCNIANLLVDSIQFTGSGYTIVSAAPGNAITLNKVFASAILCSGTANEIRVPLVLGADTLFFTVGSGKDLHLSGVVSGPGSFVKLGQGDLYLEGNADNTVAKPTTIIGGTMHLSKTGGHLSFSGPLIIGDTNGPAYAGQTYDSTVKLEASQPMSASTAVTMNPNGSLDLNGHNLTIGAFTMLGDSLATDSLGTSTLTLSDNVAVPNSPISGGCPAINCTLSLGGAMRTFNIASALYFQGTVSGSDNSGIFKTGSGNLSFYQQGSYAGTTTIDTGTIYVSGSLLNSPVVLHPGTLLSGSGAVGSVACQGGTFDPLAFIGSGNMSSKDIALDSATTFGVVYIENFQDAAAPAFLTVTGSVNLGGCHFSGIFYTNGFLFNPNNGTPFTLIQNDGNDPVIGTFAGLPEGAKFKFGGRLWQMSYHGGTGNDVVLTLLSAQLPLSTDSITVNPTNGTISVFGTGIPDTSVLTNNYELHASTNLVNWVKVANATNYNGSLSAQDLNWHSGAPRCFYRFYQL